MASIQKITPKMLTDPDRAKSDRVMNAVLKMKKIDIAELQRPYAG